MKLLLFFAVCLDYRISCGVVMVVSDKPIKGKDFFDCIGKKIGWTHRTVMVELELFRSLVWRGLSEI